VLLALVLLAPTARARAGNDPDPAGWGNVISYTMCATGVATAVTPVQWVGALTYCLQLYHDAV
jgi:hypothetical protein